MANSQIKRYKVIWGYIVSVIWSLIGVFVVFIILFTICDSPFFSGFSWYQVLITSYAICLLISMIELLDKIYKEKKEQNSKSFDLFYKLERLVLTTEDQTDFRKIMEKDIRDFDMNLTDEEISAIMVEIEPDEEIKKSFRESCEIKDKQRFEELKELITNLEVPYDNAVLGRPLLDNLLLYIVKKPARYMAIGLILVLFMESDRCFRVIKNSIYYL